MMQPWAARSRAGLALGLRALRPAALAPLARRSLPAHPPTRSAAAAPAAAAGQLRASSSSATGGSSVYVFDELFRVNHQGLPRVTIPPLEDTLKRYLASTDHLCASDEERASVQAAADEFLNGPGPALHAELELRDLGFARAGVDGPAFYFEEQWDDGYLGARCPSPININPFYILARHTAPHLQSRTGAASHLIHAALKWQTQLLRGGAPPEKSGGCVATLGRQLGTARIPGDVTDTIHTFPTSQHVVFQWHGAFYRVGVLDDHGRALGTAGLANAIDHITSLPAGHGETPVGVFTAAGRAEWAAQRRAIEAASEVNVASLEAIDSALLIIALDDGDTPTLDATSAAMLTGDGTNRWFDKHQAIVLKDGTVGFNFEHSGSDGTTWNRMVHELWHDMNSGGDTSVFGPLPPTHPEPLPEAADASSAVEKLAWELPAGTDEACAATGDEFASTVGNLDLATSVFDGFGKTTIKQMKMSPDALCQMAFQASFVRMHGHSAPTYESCSTRGFFRGRTETIRTCSGDMHTWAHAFNDSGASNEEKKALMYTAAGRHVELAKEAMQGLGCDRHMMALKNIATELGMKHDIFEQPMYAYSQTFLISSSNVTSPELAIFGFGAVTGDGYGIGYQTLQDTIPLCITSYKDSATTDNDAYLATVQDTLRAMRSLALGE